MTHTEALKLALDALGKFSIGYHVDAVELNDLIFALEAALEQPEQDCPHEADSACKECYLLRSQNAGLDRVLVEMEHALYLLRSQNADLDRVLVEMEHALNEADAIMEEVGEETADAWRKRWGRLWGRTV